MRPENDNKSENFGSVKQANAETVNRHEYMQTSDKRNTLCEAMFFVMDDRDVEKAVTPINTKGCNG